MLLLAEEVGIPSKNIAVVENGFELTFTKDSMEIGERVPGGYVYVDGAWVGDAISSQVIKDREELAITGVCTVAFVYDRQRGELIGRPRIIGRAVASYEVFPGARTCSRGSCSIGPKRHQGWYDHFRC